MSKSARRRLAPPAKAQKFTCQRTHIRGSQQEYRNAPSVLEERDSQRRKAAAEQCRGRERQAGGEQQLVKLAWAEAQGLRAETVRRAVKTYHIENNSPPRGRHTPSPPQNPASVAQKLESAPCRRRREDKTVYSSKAPYNKQDFALTQVPPPTRLLENNGQGAPRDDGGRGQQAPK